MELLKINTAGSVDDGKSTLIGRFLYDNNALTIEQEELVRKKTKEKGLTDLDFSVITDGLIAEREQGITIDVAHIYFSSLERKFIIADSPGHEEYTRNMVTGASNSDVAIILIDARKGLLPQTHRHYFISRLLQLESVVFCINKMDLVGYSEDVFLKIASDLDKMIQALPALEQTTTYIPISSLKGDHVVLESQNMQWFQGKTLSQVLHEFQKKPKSNLPFRMDIQQVFHVQNNEYVDFRSYAGTVISGEINVGDTVFVLPSKKESKVIEIIKFKDSLEKATQGNAIQIRLENEIDISRGMMLTKEVTESLFTKEINCELVWLEDSQATSGSKYTLQAGTRSVICKIKQINSIINPVSPTVIMPTNELVLNDIGNVQLQLANPVFIDDFNENKANGAFVLIDNQSNNTVAVGFVKL